jgi:hypothetical protein
LLRGDNDEGGGESCGRVEKLLLLFSEELVSH